MGLGGDQDARRVAGMPGFEEHLGQLEDHGILEDKRSAGSLGDDFGHKVPEGFGSGFEPATESFDMPNCSVEKIGKPVNSYHFPINVRQDLLLFRLCMRRSNPDRYVLTKHSRSLFRQQKAYRKLTRKVSSTVT